jgi:hypothetical protein
MKNKEQDMINLLNDLYDNELETVRINQFINELKKYDLAEMLAYHAKFPFRYVLNFLLSNPLLWINMLVNDWLKIMCTLNPRPKPFKIDIDDAGYVDIYFLCKYMRVNAIELFLQQDKFSNTDKKKLLLYFNKVACSLFMDELDLDFLDGEFFVHRDQLEIARLNLISTGEINQLKYTHHELTEYIQRELKVFSTPEE